MTNCPAEEWTYNTAPLQSTRQQRRNVFAPRTRRYPLRGRWQTPRGCTRAICSPELQGESVLGTLEGSSFFAQVREGQKRGAAR